MPLFMCYNINKLRDNIIKESIVQLTIRFINEKKFKLPNVEGSVMTISTKENDGIGGIKE